MHGGRALVGLLNNPVVPSIIKFAPDLIEYIDVIPDRLWYDFETFHIVRAKLDILNDALGCDVILENGAVFTPVPDTDMSEPEFLNRLYSELDCGTLLHLHNLYVGQQNGILSPLEYLEQLNPNCVQEIHIAGGDELAGFYTDSHSRLTPDEVWAWAYKFGPRFKNLRAIVFEFHESYFDRLG